MKSIIPALAVLLLGALTASAQFDLDFDEMLDPNPGPFVHDEDTVAVLAGIRDAHRSAGLVKIAGELRGEWVVMGRPTKHRAAFTTEVAPGHLQHTIDAGPTLIADATQSYVHFIDVKQYAEYPGLQPDATRSTLPPVLVELLLEQNPAALLVLAADGEKILLGEKPTVRAVDPIDIDGQAFPALEIWRDDVTYTVAYDPSTKLLRHIRADLQPKLTAEGVVGVESAALVIDYTSMRTGLAPTEPIGWIPPRDARLIGRDNPVELIRADADTLEGRPAPQFNLKSLAGEAVSLADLKGEVIVLDFWATWCPPCREGLPHIAKLHANHKDAGVRVYAVNLRETPAKIRNFLEQQKIDVPVLLDADGGVARGYGVSGIPTTVVIGRDGVIRKVFVGFSPEIAKSLDAAVESAMQR